MAKELFYTDDALPPLPCSSQAVISKGHIYVSGCIGCTADHAIVMGGIEPQTRVALKNMSDILEAAGSGMEHIVKMTVYLVHLASDSNVVDTVYQEFIMSASFPARTCVEVTALPNGAFIQLDCIAEIP